MDDKSRIVICVTVLVVFQFLSLVFLLGIWRDIRRTRSDVAKIAVLVEDTGERASE